MWPEKALPQMSLNLVSVFSAPSGSCSAASCSGCSATASSWETRTSPRRSTGSEMWDNILLCFIYMTLIYYLKFDFLSGLRLNLVFYEAYLSALFFKTWKTSHMDFQFSVLLLPADHGLRHRRGVPQVLSSGKWKLEIMSVHVGCYDKWQIAY